MLTKKSLAVLPLIFLYIYLVFNYKAVFSSNDDNSVAYYLFITISFCYILGVATIEILGRRANCLLPINLYFVFCILISVYSSFIFSDQKLMVLLSILGIMTINFKLLHDFSRLHLFLISIALIYVVEVLLGFIQVFQAIAHSKVLILNVKGTFQNSSVFSCYIVCHIPLFCYFISVSKATNRKKHYYIHLSFSIAIVILIATSSRTAAVALVTYLLYYLLRLRNFHARLLTFGCLFIITVVLVNYSLTKQASASGRFLIWKISA